MQHLEVWELLEEVGLSARETGVAALPGVAAQLGQVRQVRGEQERGLCDRLVHLNHRIREQRRKIRLTCMCRLTIAISSCSDSASSKSEFSDTDRERDLELLLSLLLVTKMHY